MNPEDFPENWPESAQAIKHDQGKSRIELLPFDALEEVAQVMTFGATKYGDRNWELGFKWTRLIGSTLRHLFAWSRGEDKDPESGLNHMAHAACNVLFLLTFVVRGVGDDDRAKAKKEVS